MHMCSINMFVYLKPLECWGGGYAAGPSVELTQVVPYLTTTSSLGRGLPLNWLGCRGRKKL